MADVVDVVAIVVVGVGGGTVVVHGIAMIIGGAAVQKGFETRSLRSRST